MDKLRNRLNKPLVGIHEFILLWKDYVRFAKRTIKEDQIRVEMLLFEVGEFYDHMMYVDTPEILQLMERADYVMELIKRKKKGIQETKDWIWNIAYYGYLINIFACKIQRVWRDYKQKRMSIRHNKIRKIQTWWVEKYYRPEGNKSKKLKAHFESLC